jgi:hypothetical protein
MEGNICMLCGYTGGGGERLGETNHAFFFLFLGILRVATFIFVKSSFFIPEIDNNKIIKYCFVTCYIRNIHG